MKLVMFGAGKIGRSFIAQLFSLGGYEVVFIDIYKKIIDELNYHRSYNLIIKSDENEQVIKIENVRGIHSGDSKSVIEELIQTDIIAVSVGLNGLEKVFPILAEGLEKRYNSVNRKPVDIIIAENMRDAEEFFRGELMKYLPAGFPIREMAGLIETSIGKMVPIMQKKHIEEDMLQIFAEPYNTLILNRKAFLNPIPDIKGLSPKDNMKAWVDRKLFIHNLGHSAAAYIGHAYDPKFIYIYEALAVPEVVSDVRMTMLQAAKILLKKYPDEFTLNDLDLHIHDLLTRFQNKALGDTIFRVGCDLKRKLGPEDRMAGAIKTALDFDLPYDKILYALICGCHFRAKDEEGYMLREDVEFVNRYQNDIKLILKDVCGFDEILDNQIFQEAEAISGALRLLLFTRNDLPHQP